MSDATASFGRFFEIVRRLRDPESGCPWDLEQTARSLRSSLLEEAYECVDAIDQNDTPNLREELGDVFLLATMIAYIEQQRGSFTAAGVLDEASDKLIRRHPHIFGDASNVSTTDQVRAQWDQIKVDVEGKRAKESVLDEVSRSLPPLERAFKLQKKAAKVGFDWDDHQPVREKVLEELAECTEAASSGDHEALEMELGDLLFSAINLARSYGIDPQIALNRSNEKFGRRFRAVEAEMRKRELPLDSAHMQEMDRIWESQKTAERE